MLREPFKKRSVGLDRRGRAGRVRPLFSASVESLEDKSFLNAAPDRPDLPIQISMPDMELLEKSFQTSIDGPTGESIRPFIPPAGALFDGSVHEFDREIPGLGFFSDPWRVVGAPMDGPPPQAESASLLQDPPPTPGAPISKMWLPEDLYVRLQGRLDAGAPLDFYHLPTSPDLRAMNLEIWGPPVAPGSGDPARIRAWLFDHEGHLLDQWVLDDGRGLQLYFHSTRPSRDPDLVLAIGPDLSDAALAAFLAGNTADTTNAAASLSYGFQVTRWYRTVADTTADPSGTILPDYEPVNPPGTRANQAIAGSSAGTINLSFTGSSGTMASRPAVRLWSLGSDNDLDAPAVVSRSARALPLQSGSPSGGYLGGSSTVESEAEGTAPDPEDEPVLERLVRAGSRNAGRDLLDPEIEAAIDLLAWDMEQDAGDGSEPSHGGEDGLETVQDSWGGPLLGASLLADRPRGSVRGSASEPGREFASAPIMLREDAAMAAGEPATGPPSEDGSPVTEKLSDPTVRTAVVTTAAVMVGLWLPEVGPIRPSLIRRRLRLPSSMLVWWLLLEHRVREFFFPKATT